MDATISLVMEEIREQRSDTRRLSEALAQNALAVERLGAKVDQVHKDLSSIGDLLDRINKIEQAHEGLRTKVTIYSSGIGAVAAIVIAWGLNLIAPFFGA